MTLGACCAWWASTLSTQDPRNVSHAIQKNICGRIVLWTRRNSRTPKAFALRSPATIQRVVCAVAVHHSGYHCLDPAVGTQGVLSLNVCDIMWKKLSLELLLANPVNVQTNLVIENGAYKKTILYLVSCYFIMIYKTYTNCNWLCCCC